MECFQLWLQLLKVLHNSRWMKQIYLPNSAVKINFKFKNYKSQISKLSSDLSSWKLITRYWIRFLVLLWKLFFNRKIPMMTIIYIVYWNLGFKDPIHTPHCNNHASWSFQHQKSVIHRQSREDYSCLKRHVVSMEYNKQIFKNIWLKINK